MNSNNNSTKYKCRLTEQEEYCTRKTYTSLRSDRHIVIDQPYVPEERHYML